jgi:plasmid maintenance system antidote protein VapI
VDKERGDEEFGVGATAIAEKLGMPQPAVSISIKMGEKIAKEMGLQLDR